MKVCLCFLTVCPTMEDIMYFNSFKNKKYDVVVVVDDNTCDTTLFNKDLKIIQISEKVCVRNGFNGSMHYYKNLKKPCARDKALYFFTRKEKSYDYVWFIEEDVFIPSQKLLTNIDNKHKQDLLVSSHIDQTKDVKWAHWEFVKTHYNLKLPYHRGLVCIVRCSKIFLDKVSKFAKTHKKILIDEVFFNTLAEYNNLTTFIPGQFKGIKWQKHWFQHELKSTMIYHPIKGIKYHYFFKKQLEYAKYIKQGFKINNMNTTKNAHSDPYALAQLIVNSHGGEENLLKTFSFEDTTTELHKKTVTRTSYIQPPLLWYVNGVERVSGAEQRGEFCIDVWLWTLQPLVHPDTKLELMESIYIDDVLCCRLCIKQLKVGDQLLKTDIRILFEADSLNLKKIVWKGKSYIFSKHTQTHNTRVPLACTLYSGSGQWRVKTIINSIQPLTCLPQF